MSGHDEVRQLRLDRGLRRKRYIFAGNTIRPERVKQVKLGVARAFGAMIRQVDDLALDRSIDRTMGLVDKAAQAFGMPVIAARLPLFAVHALLHHGPFAVIGDEEAVQIELETVLHGGAVNFGDQPAGPRQRPTIDTGPLANRSQFIRRAPRVLAAAAADVNPEFALQRRQPALQGADHAGSDAG